MWPPAQHTKEISQIQRNTELTFHLRCILTEQLQLGLSLQNISVTEKLSRYSYVFKANGFKNRFLLYEKAKEKQLLLPHEIIL
jgi:hypothetical protein